MQYRKAIIYRRISSKGQLKLKSLTTQERVCRDWIESNYPYLPIEIYEDIGSGWNKNKQKEYELGQDLQKIVDFCQWTVIVIYRIDRFLRDVKTAEKILPILKKNNNRIVFVKENFEYHQYSEKNVYLEIIEGIKRGEMFSTQHSECMKDAWETKRIEKANPELEDEEWKLEYDSESEDENKSAFNRRKIEALKVQEENKRDQEILKSRQRELEERLFRAELKKKPIAVPCFKDIFEKISTLTDCKSHSFLSRELIDNYFDDRLFSKKAKIKHLIQTCSEGKYDVATLNQHLLQLSSVAFSLQVEEVPTSWDGMAALLNLFEICWVPEIPKGEWTAEKAKAFN